MPPIARSLNETRKLLTRGENAARVARWYPRRMGFLVKEEPGNYHFTSFVKDGGTEWSGVKNPLAQKHLRSIRKGDLVFYYHTGDEKAIVGIARAAANARPDPADPAGKAFVVDLVPVRALKRPITLAEVKADKRFKDFPLTYLPRLSVMPVDDTTWERLLSLEKLKA